MYKKTLLVIVAISFLLGAAVSLGAGYFLVVGPTNGTISVLENKLADAQSEIGRLGTLVGRQDEIARREASVTRREREIALREAEDNRRTKAIYSELRDIIRGSLDDISAIEAIAVLVSKMEQNINH